MEKINLLTIDFKATSAALYTALNSTLGATFKYAMRYDYVYANYYAETDGIARRWKS